MKKLLSIFLILSLSFIASCGDNQEVKDENTLRVGLTADYPPFEFMKDNVISGFDLDLANMIAKELGKKLSVHDMDWDTLIPAVQTGRIDCVISGMTASDERKENVDFSIPYYDPKFAMIYRRDNEVKTLKDLNSSIIGVQLGSSMETFLKGQIDQVQNLDIVSLKRTPTMIQELKLSRLDGVLVEEAQAKEFVGKDQELSYSIFESDQPGVAIAFAKNSPLIAQVNAALTKLQDSGEMDKLRNKWLMDDSQ
jgi:polar amino acid transport system substrate-binding protein